jgi:hypothetical protein
MAGRKGEDDFRHFLVALKNIKNVRKNGRYKQSELNEMIRISSFFDKAKEVLKSPYFIGFITLIGLIITVALQMLGFFWKR